MDRYDAPGPSRLGQGYTGGQTVPDESPLDGRTDAPSETWASASGRTEGSMTEAEDYFVGVKAEETEVEERREKLPEARKMTPPIPLTWKATPRRSANNAASSPKSLGASVLPYRIGLPFTGRGRRLGFMMTRRRCEDGLLLFGVGYGVYRLASMWKERALAGEISLLAGFSIAYKVYRDRSATVIAPISQPIRTASPTHFGTHLQPNGLVRERSPRLSSAGFPGQETRGASQSNDALTGHQGCVWGTEEREYRECLDDGVLFALLLGPLLASGLLHYAMQRLPSSTLRSRAWLIEHPLVLASTPIRHTKSQSQVTDTARALSALMISRRNLVQLFTLCSFVLLVHLFRSLLLERSLAKLETNPSSVGMERDVSDGSRGLHGIGTYWLRKGEFRRNARVIGFAFFVTTCCIGVKIATAYIGRGVWSDIIIATLFYQFSLYVCVRLAKRGFTLGELAIVCNAATALTMETVNMTRMKIALIRTPYIKTYRLPTPLLTFQLALIPGSLLTGFLLSPVLYLSRHLAQKPVHRLRFPDEKATHRRLLAIGFYAGALIICGGLVGTWTRWCLNWRDPVFWVIWYMMDGKRWWSRPALIGYWAGLAVVSVAAWSRQLNRARRHRRYVVPGTTVAGPTPLGGEGGLSGVASQMMDAADQRLPTFSVNGRRKWFHALAVVMFVPGIALDPAFSHLAFSVAFAAFNFAEYIRYFALWPFGVSIHLFLNEFLDAKDSGSAILSHFYLLTGCATPLWLEGSEVLMYFGVLVLGVGDALASIVGRRYGRLRWSGSNGKTIEGTVAFLVSVLVSTLLLWAFGLVQSFDPIPYVVTTTLTAILEAVSAQNDNLLLPMYGWAVGTLLS